MNSQDNKNKGLTLILGGNGKTGRRVGGTPLPQWAMRSGSDRGRRSRPLTGIMKKAGDACLEGRNGGVHHLCAGPCYAGRARCDSGLC